MQEIRATSGAPGALAQLPRPPLLPSDFPVAGGHFFTQGGGTPPATGSERGAGFAITDDPQTALWSVYQRHGGVASLGYPISSRYTPDSSELRFVYQATQRGLLQADVRTGQAALANALDLLAGAGLDGDAELRHWIAGSEDWSADAGSTWDEIVERHFGLLDRQEVPTALRDAYLANRDNIVQWGLPLGFRAYGDVASLRTQRAVLQWWRQETPWARAGDVTLVNLGDVLKEYGLLPAAALIPRPGPDPVARGAVRLERLALVDTATGTRFPLQPDARQAPLTLLETGSYLVSATVGYDLVYPLAGLLDARVGLSAAAASGETDAAASAEWAGGCRGCEEPVQRGSGTRTVELGPLPARAGALSVAVALTLRGAAPEGDAAVALNGSALAAVTAVAPVDVVTGQAAAARRLRDAGFRALPVEQALTLGVRELVAEGRSSFHGSAPERIHNIRLAASRLNGAVVQPGATFSFLKAVGEISAAAGYQEGLVIAGDQTVPGVGGGVCQVSTTMFRAAFWAGVPIIERNQHSYRVGYYEQHDDPVGFDAAVYSPGLDLRWVNDTGRTLVIQSEFDASGELAFKLYGVKPERRVEFRTSGPTNVVQPGPPLPDSPDPRVPRGTRKQVEFAAAGMDVTVTRIVRGADGSERADRFTSKYVPWRTKWVYGTR